MKWIAAVAVTLLAGRLAAAPVPFADPPEIRSANGVLEGTLTIAPTTLRIGGKRVSFPGLYNGSYAAPLLRVEPSDVVRLTVANDSTLATNVHYHGLTVTPLGNADNVFLSIPGSGGSLTYDFPIPADHPQGLFWYHPHVHPNVNRAIAAGLSGGLIVGDVLRPFPGLQGIRERVMLLKDLKIQRGAPKEDPDPTGPTRRTINGLFRPTVDIRHGELQLWRIGNIGANIYYKLRLDGHRFFVIAQDGNLKNQVIETRELEIPPAARYEVLVRGGRPGKYKLRALRFNTGPAGDHYPAQVMATLVSRGPAVPQLSLPTSFPPVPDLRQVPLTGQRSIVFDDADDGFTINGQMYVDTRIDTVVNLGSVEEWTIENRSKELHVFHIHQTDFQVTEINGARIPLTGYQDTVSLPFATKKGGPGVVKVIIPFTNPVSVGNFVYHCHIVQHADQGMMANIQLVDPAAPGTVGPPGHR
jgi:FtsP/CotA-like multicopper oxidase with cupredoxin domain